MTERASLDALVEPWRTSAVRAGNAFMTPEWFLSYLEYAPLVRPYVVVAKEEGLLRGLLPLVEARGVLRFPAAEVGDRFQPLWLGTSEENVVERTFSALGNSRPPWKLAVLEKLDGDAAQRMRATLRHTPLRTVTSGRDRLPVIEFGSRTWEQYLEARSRNFRSEIGRKERSLSRGRELRFLEFRDGNELPPALEEHFALHDKRSQERGSAGVESNWVRPFFRTFALAGAAEHWLRLWHLTVNDKPVATWCGWSIGGRYCYYQAGLDDTWSRFSPGTLLLAHTIRAAMDEGCSEYDLLLGAEPYKSRFSSDWREVTTLVTASQFRPRLALDAARWRLQLGMRRLPPRLRRKLR